MTLLTHAEYLALGRQIANLLGSALGGPSAEALCGLARAYDPTAEESRIGAEVFLFHKYLLMQACLGVFPTSQCEHIIGGLFAALNERASGLELGPERQRAMETMWQLRVGQFNRPFAEDRSQLLDDQAGPFYWKQTIGRFCQNVCEFATPPDLWAGSNSPSHRASQTVSATLDQMVAALEEINRLRFGEIR